MRDDNLALYSQINAARAQPNEDSNIHLLLEGLFDHSHSIQARSAANAGQLPCIRFLVEVASPDTVPRFSSPPLPCRPFGMRVNEPSFHNFDGIESNCASPSIGRLCTVTTIMGPGWIDGWGMDWGIRQSGRAEFSVMRKIHLWSKYILKDCRRSYVFWCWERSGFRIVGYFKLPPAGERC